jgi:vacuolar protein sorting-associated protein 54
MSNILCAAHFQALATNVVGKVAELLRLFNSRSTHLVLGAGAIHSSARLKSINAKHLAIVTQCVGVVQSILPHIRAALMSQLPIKQHTLLVDLDKIKKDYAEHHNKVLDKFVSIIGGIVEHSLAPKIAGTDFDQRGKGERGNQIECCQFLDGVITNTKKMHQVLHSLLPQEDLADVFSRIFAHLDSKVPKMFLSMDSDTNVQFTLPQTLEGKNQIVLELNTMATTLNSLEDVTPWDFGAMNFLARRLEIVQDHGHESPLGQEPSDENQLNITSGSDFQEALDETSSPQTARSTEEIQVVDSSLITSNETEPRNAESGSGHEISEEEHKHGDEKDDSLTASCGEVNDISMNDDENMINNENEEEDSKTLADT